LKHLLAALAGQPNCGKSTIFNMLTGAHQHVANYPGVTVEKKSGSFRHDDVSVELVDLPGTYAFASWSLEEKVARQFILEEDIDQLVAVLDASTLEKSLYFCVQLLEMQRPTIAALNMLDVAEKRKIDVDAEALSRALGIPVVRVQASKGRGKAELRDAIVSSKGVVRTDNVIDYGVLEPAIARIQSMLPAEGLAGYPARWLAVKLLEDDDVANDAMLKAENGEAVVAAAHAERDAIMEGGEQDPVRLTSNARFKKARELAASCSRREAFVSSLTEKVDAVACHRFFGPLLLLAVLFFFYQASVTYGNILAAKVWPIWGWVEETIAAFLPMQGFLDDPLLTSLVNWLVKSVTAVLNYLPIFIIMFALVAILEDSGYMARIAFILDRLFHRMGLHGQSTLPLILGGVYVGGCIIPAVIATKAIPDERARMNTILILPMMNCLAKVPLYLLLVASFFSANAGSAMFFIGSITLILALIVSKILSLTLLKNLPSAPFIIELPIYHMPSPYGVFRQTFDRIWMFLKKIGTVIIAVAVIIFVLINYPGLPEEREAYYIGQQNALMADFEKAVARTSLKGQLTGADIVPLLYFQDDLRASKRGKSKEEAAALNEQAKKENPAYAAVVLRQGKDGKTIAGALRKIESKRKTLRREMRQERFEDSFLGRAGKALEPFTKWAGFTWRINVALLSALAAKENSAATLGAIYGLDGTSIAEGMTSISGFTPLHALALMLFMAMYPPCVPAAIMVKMQAGSTRWMLFSIFFQMTIGIVLATLVFTGGTLLQLTGYQTMWAFYALCLILLVIMVLIPQRKELHNHVTTTGSSLR